MKLQLQTSNKTFYENYSEVVLVHMLSYSWYKHSEINELCNWLFQVVGTVGYAAPEYMQTGRLTAKSDVWSYGIFLYELITGRRPMDTNRPKNEQKLLEWVRPHLADMKKFQMILDPRLNGKYSIKSAQRLAAIANRCLVRKSKLRPKMSEVLEMVNLLMETTETENPEIAVKIIIPKDSRERSLKEGLKKRLVDPIVGENRSLVWQTWRPKLVTDSPTAWLQKHT